MDGKKDPANAGPPKTAGDRWTKTRWRLTNPQTFHGSTVRGKTLGAGSTTTIARWPERPAEAGTGSRASATTTTTGRRSREPLTEASSSAATIRPIFGGSVRELTSRGSGAPEAWRGPS